MESRDFGTKQDPEIRKPPFANLPRRWREGPRYPHGACAAVSRRWGARTQKPVRRRRPPRPAPAPPLPLAAVPPSPANPNTPGASARDLSVVVWPRDAAAGGRRPRGLRAAPLHGVAAHQPQAPRAARCARSGEWPPVALARGCLADLGHRGHGPWKG